MFSTLEMALPINLFKRVDLPTLGLPIIAIGIQACQFFKSSTLKGTPSFKKEDKFFPREMISSWRVSRFLPVLALIATI